MQKKLYCRHLCKTNAIGTPSRFYLHLSDSSQSQIAICKGFSAYIPAINYIFQVNGLIHNPDGHRGWPCG